MARYWIWPLSCLLLFISVSAAAAMEQELFKREQFQGGPWKIRAEEITYDAAQHLYTARGQVEIRQGDRRITADQIEVNEVTKVARVQGHVVLVLDEDIFTGEAGQFNLATRGGEMQNAKLFLKKNHFNIQSAMIRKTGDNSYYAEEARVTTCDADHPVWSFAARQLNVVVEGYATGKDGVFRLGGVPVLYLPTAVLPVATARQSGFLMPYYGQHKAGGTIAEVPFYWAVDNFNDVTLYQTYMTNRGYMQGGEFRHHGHDDAAANFQMAFLNDRKVETTTNHRYWVAGMMNQPLGDWNLRLTLDKVSDASYLRDFNWGYMGLNRYSRELLMDFGRDLEQDDVNTRVSSLVVARNFSLANFTAYTRYYEKLIPADPNLFNRLPGFSFTSVPVPVPLGRLPLYLGLDSSYNYFLQDHGMNGDRLDFHPIVQLQEQVIPGLSFASRTGFRETLFRIDHNVPTGPAEGYIPRQIYDSRVSLAGALARDYGREDSPSSFFRHVLRPEIAYWNITRYNPQRYPDFDPFDQGWVARANRNLPVRDGDDPIGGVNALTYGISNNILWRGQNQQGLAAVKDLFWLRLSQSSFFNSSNMGLDGTSIHHHPFSDFLGEMEVYPLRQVTLGMNVGVSPYSEAFDRSDVKVTFMDSQRQNYVNVNYIFIKDFAKQINVETYLNLMRSVKTWFTYAHTFETGKKLENRYGIVFQRECWGVVLSYTDRPDDQRIGFTVFIPGLGEKLKRSPVRFPDESKDKQGPDYF